MGERPGILFRFELLDALEQLAPADVGNLFLSVMRYGKDGVLPEFKNPVLSVLWPFLKSAADRDAESYDSKTAQRRYALYCREMKRKEETPLSFEDWKTSVDIEANRPILSDVHTQIHTQTQIQTHTQEQEQGQKQEHTSAGKPPAPARRKFAPPSLDEVAEYVRERGSRVDPQGFIDFYSSKGWLVGKTPMKDWKAACRNAESWERWHKPQATDRNRLRTPDEYENGDFFGGDI